MRSGELTKDVDAYLARVPAPHRAMLYELRKIIHAAAPKATEGIAYGMPAYKYQGPLVYFAAFKTHCSFFPGSGRILKGYRSQLKDYETAKGTIRFTVEKPLSANLVRAIVKARVAENVARMKKKTPQKQ